MTEIKKRVLCPNHALEIYFWEYYFHIEEFEISDKALHRQYQKMAEQFTQSGENEKAQEMLKMALSYNPVDLDILVALAKSYYRSQNLDRMYKTIDQMYPYIYSRGDMARYYGLLGEFYLEKYQTDIAESLFRYSNIFMQNQQADIDLEFLRQAVGYNMEKVSVEELQKNLQGKQIPIQAKKETLGLLFQVAEQASREKKEDYALQLFTFLYELSGDEEIYDRITKAIP